MTKNIDLERKRTATAAQRALEEEGLVLAAKPSFQLPRVPVQLADLDDRDLMKLFVSLTRWADYANGQLALAMINERYAEGLLVTAEATALVRDWGGGRDDKVTLAKAERENDPDVKACKEDLAVCYARRKLIESIFTNAERDSAVVSRELTRRIGRLEVNDRRVSRWTP